MRNARNICNRNAEDYGKVAVLMGGSSAERDISIVTGEAIHKALQRKNINSHMVDTRENTVEKIGFGDYDRAFIALHGRGGEDGVIQGALEVMNIPYTGSGVLGSALTMDKVMTKWVWLSQGILTPDFIEITDINELERVSSEIGYPVMIKPVSEGSSCGASKVKDGSELKHAWMIAKRYDDRVMAERWVEGSEYTASIINDSLLPLIRLETPREFYDYEAKYIEDSTQYICPCGLSHNAETRVGVEVLKAFKIVEASGWGRVDFFIDESNRIWMIEINTVPGMTSHSLVPMAAKQAGIGFDDLVLMILETSMFPIQSLEEAEI